ncbi:hypothetical protein [Streptomyces sp. NBC_00057]|uniref:hypothetical protein n=1 Tax=Streptomyces sp. NBC_00057 TaxID=2975634 RepID=UPI0032559191
MSSLALLVLVVVLVLGALGYLAHRHPALAAPLMVAMGGAAVLAACIVPHCRPMTGQARCWSIGLAHEQFGPGA